MRLLLTCAVLLLSMGGVQAKSIFDSDVIRTAIDCRPICGTRYCCVAVLERDAPSLPDLVMSPTLPLPPPRPECGPLTECVPDIDAVLKDIFTGEPVLTR